MSTELTVRWNDSDGQKATNKFHFAGTADPSTVAPVLVPLLDAISDAAISGVDAMYADNTVVGTAVAGPYATAKDKLELLFQGAGGGFYRITIPAPDESMFLPDKETFDAAGAGAASLATILTHATDPNGGALTYISGKRIKRRRKKS